MVGQDTKGGAIGKDPLIANPYARDLLTYKLNDQGQVTLESKLPPLETTVHLMQMAFRTMFTYIDIQIERIQKEGSRIERP